MSIEQNQPFDYSALGLTQEDATTYVQLLNERGRLTWIVLQTPATFLDKNAMDAFGTAIASNNQSIRALEEKYPQLAPDREKKPSLTIEPGNVFQLSPQHKEIGITYSWSKRRDDFELEPAEVELFIPEGVDKNAVISDIMEYNKGQK